MPELRVTVLGTLAIEHGEEPLCGPSAIKARALLVYLAATGRAHSRQALAGLLWSDVQEDLARTSLRKALVQVRKAVGDHVQADRQSVWLDRTRTHWVDAQVFEEACRRLQVDDALDADRMRIYRGHVHLYRDAFLAGFPETDAALFEEWAVLQRERYRHLALRALQRLADDALSRTDLEPGIEDARRALELDPLREETHRTLMQLLAKSGNVAAALRQYEECVRILTAELGVPPSDDTVALARSLRDGSWTGARGTRPAAELDAPAPNNLPSVLTPTVGRQAELAMLDDLIGEEEVRLISILGPGGIGKTRLALATGQRQAEQRRFSQGVYFAELAQVDGADRLVTAVADAVRLPLQVASGYRRSPKEQLLSYLRGKELLLILDNFEHVLDGAALIDEILQAAQHVKIVTTSRERLRLPGEQALPIGGLDCGHESASFIELIPAAVQFFEQCARRAEPAFSLSEQQLPSVVQICNAVDGIPLGIELAASWVSILTPAEIAHELGRNLDILENRQRGAPARHRSIRAVFDTTWQRLNDAERMVFSALSVFNGGFTRESAQIVAGASLRQLGTLAGKSLIRFDRDRGRYALHEMLRQYGAERLADDAETEYRVRRRHCVYFCEIAHVHGEDLLGRSQMESIAVLEREAENLRAAWQWAVRGSDWALVDTAMDGLGFFHEWMGRLGDGEELFQMAAGALEAGDGRDSSRLLAHANTWRSVFAHGQGRPIEANDLLCGSLQLLEQLPIEERGRVESLAFAWLRSGIHAFWRDDQKMRDSFARSLSLYQSIGHRWGVARSLIGLAQADAETGNYHAAAERFREALARLREAGDRRSEAHSLHRLAILLRNTGNVKAALARASESCRLYSEMGDRAGIAWSTQILAECNTFAGAYEESLRLLLTAEAQAKELGDSARLANIYQERALVLGRMGRSQEALVQGELGLTLARQISQSVRIAWCQIVLANVDLSAGAYASADDRLRESEALLDELQRGHEMAVVYGLQARAALALGERTRARQLTLAALELSSRHRDFRVFIGLRALLWLLADTGRADDALTVYAHLATWQNETAGIAEAHSRKQFAFLLDQIPTRVVDDAIARTQDSDVWEFVASWIAELETQTV